MIIFILIIFIILGVLFYNNKKVEIEHFKIENITNLNKRLKKFIKKNDKKESEKQKKKVFDHENEDPSKKYLYNNKIVITGATGGIGYYVAKMINFHKPILVICGKKKQKVLEVVGEFKKFNPNVHGIAMDLSTKDGAKKLHDEIFKKVKSVDILINNAIIKKGSQSLFSKKYEDWFEEISVNINSNLVLSQGVAYKMRNRKNEGRIINISNDSPKTSNIKNSSGSEILLNNMIEKYSKILANELYNYKIAVTTIRIDERINLKKKFVIENEFYNKYISTMIGIQPSKIMPVFMYAIKAPFHEITGKILSTSQYKDIYDDGTPKIIPPHQIKLNKIYKKFKYTKTIKKNENKTYLVKQNPFPMSPNITKFISKLKINNLNDISKYNTIIDRVIAEKVGIKKHNIVLFKTEFDCIKKLTDIFIPKYNNIIASSPIWNYLDLLSNEHKFTIKNIPLIEHDKNNKVLVPNYDIMIEKINPETKVIYVSSPNITSGKNISHETFVSFMDRIPDNVVVIIDQRYIEFSLKTFKKDGVLDPIRLINKYSNLVIIRTFNNLYSIETLELTYIITNKTLTKIIRDSQIINPIDRYTEEIALNVIDDSYYLKKIKKLKLERDKLVKILDENKIPNYNSDINFILVKTKIKKDEIIKLLEKKGIILYESNDNYNSYWTLPLGTPEINELVIETILYSDL
jgi:histidinol-phosphate aminotransferase